MILRDHHAGPHSRGVGGIGEEELHAPAPLGAFLLVYPRPPSPAIGYRVPSVHWPVLLVTSETHVGASGADWLAYPTNHGGDRRVPWLRGG